MNPQQPERIQVQSRKNKRGINEHYITGKHVSLQDLKEREIQDDPMMRYLEKNIPPYPTPVKFWVSDVSHVTEKSGFEGIMQSEEFRPGARKFSWWSLKISENEIREAEKCYMEEKQQTATQPFLEKFTTSPAFEPESRYGNYRFTFPLADLMKWYKKENCGGKEPVLRVYETATYKQEILYSVLIHSPEDNEAFGEYPLLDNSEWVKYQDGKIVWKAQAICETHRYQFVGEVEELESHQFYIWDHVSLVFYLPKAKTLKIPRIQLIKSLGACQIDKIDLTKEEKYRRKSDKYIEAVRKVNELKESKLQ